jgi:hypothetical protein
MGSGLCGIVSVVDSAYSVHRLSCLSLMPNLYHVVLSLFARIANVPDVDPTQRMRHRRASSTSSHSSSLNIVRELSRSGSLSQSSRDFAHSRSNSRTSIRLSQSPRVVPIADVSSPRLVSSLGLGDIRDSPRMAPTLGAGDRNSVGLDLGELMGRWE